MSNQKGENMQQEATDYSNARIIEWEEGGEAFVGARTSRRNGFRTVSAGPGGSANYAGFLTELEAENVGARVVAEFPPLSLAEIVGDAPAFLVTDADGEPAIAYRIEPGDDGLWHLRLLRFGSNVLGERPLHAFDAWGFDPSSVVPLFPREVVS